MARRASAFGNLLGLLFLPITWLLRPFIGRKRANPGLVKWFYKTPEWKRLRYDHLEKNTRFGVLAR